MVINSNLKIRKIKMTKQNLTLTYSGVSRRYGFDVSVIPVAIQRNSEGQIEKTEGEIEKNTIQLA